MAGSLNKVLLIGRLGADPEIKQMVNGKSVARLSLATSNTWKDKNTGEKKEKTEWHRVVIFNEGLVNVVQQYVKKGAQVYIEGQLTTRKWRDEKAGIDKYSTEVVLQGFNSSFKILSSKNNQIENIQENNNTKSSLPDSETPPSNDLDDEIPF
jgi:single-strand DNA-binding protein|tara:strand:+ start:926 stop:1384 length:459 start_codon:yes stop_codon:yes gene_type:complete